MSDEQLRRIVREVSAGDLSASALARVFTDLAGAGGGIAPADLSSHKWGSNTEDVFEYADWAWPDDVTRVLWEQEGENDGENWAALCLLADGRWGFVEAGCDYTGWDCQAWGESAVAGDLEELLTMHVGNDWLGRMADAVTKLLS